MDISTTLCSISTIITPDITNINKYKFYQYFYVAGHFYTMYQFKELGEVIGIFSSNFT